MTLPVRQSESVEALWNPGGRVAFFAIQPATDRPPIACAGCHRGLDGTLDGGMGFFVEASYPDGSGTGGMAVCAECAAEAMMPRVLLYQARLRGAPGRLTRCTCQVLPGGHRLKGTAICPLHP